MKNKGKEILNPKVQVDKEKKSNRLWNWSLSSTRILANNNQKRMMTRTQKKRIYLIPSTSFDAKLIRTCQDGLNLYPTQAPDLDKDNQVDSQKTLDPFKH